MLFVRFDLRMHRKIVVIDGRIGYTGSINLVDPRYFKRGEGFGQWVDAMVRVEGPAVEALQITFLGDWYEETDATLEDVQQEADAEPQPSRGDCPVQVMPSGPDLPAGSVDLVLLTAVFSARRELVITTPYFMPNESLSAGVGGRGATGRERDRDHSKESRFATGSLCQWHGEGAIARGGRADCAIRRRAAAHQKCDDRRRVLTCLGR